MDLSSLLHEEKMSIDFSFCAHWFLRLVIFWALQIRICMYLQTAFDIVFLISGKCTAMYWGSNWMNSESCGQWMIHVHVLRAKSNFPWNW